MIDLNAEDRAWMEGLRPGDKARRSARMRHFFACTVVKVTKTQVVVEDDGRDPQHRLLVRYWKRTGLKVGDNTVYYSRLYPRE